MNLDLAYSPCPNDTFMFHAIASGRCGLPEISFRLHLHDVETLNQKALKATYDITKISFHAWLMIRGQYSLLSAGAALGFGCGPLVIALKPLVRNDLRHCRIALPGELTTAHLLFQLWAPQAKDKVFVPYDRIFDLVADKRADCGVVIHEGRFTYEEAGFHLVADLGAWWEEKTGLPIPLGCIAVARELPSSLITHFEECLRASILDAGKNPAGLLEYMKKHAQEMDEAVLKKHVGTYVNEFSLDLGERGRAAVAELEKMALCNGVIT